MELANGDLFEPDVSNIQKFVHPETGLASAYPRYPLLHKSEVELTDRRGELSADIQEYLHNDEIVVDIRQLPEITFRPDKPITAEAVIMKASGAKTTEGIGDYGPAIASVNPEEGAVEDSRYAKPHARDAIITGRQTAPRFPKLQRANVKYFAELQGVRNEIYVPGQPYGAEKQGGIVLISRGKDFDAAGAKFAHLKGWGEPYYGSIDAPGAMINAIADIVHPEPTYLRSEMYKDRNAVISNMAVAMDRCSEWMLNRVSENPDGLIEYHNPVPGGGGLRNQGWRDSDEALQHADGAWANGDFGIAALDVQVEAYAAARNAQYIYDGFLDKPKRAQEMAEIADHLQDAVTEKFWVHDDAGSYLASGRDRDGHGHGRNLETRTSAMARALCYGIFRSNDLKKQRRYDEMVEEILWAVTAPDMLTRWGMRTMSSLETGYRPFGYHTGACWPHDTGFAAWGASEHEYFGLDRLIGAGPIQLHKETGYHYEFTSGDDGEKPSIPNQDVYVYNSTHDVMYLVMQRPPNGQTWAAGALIELEHRYRITPERATDTRKRAFEEKIIARLAA